jgi:hypothetical protein
MKQLFAGLLLISSLNLLAGEIVNRKTSESIKLDLNKTDSTLFIESNTTLVDTKTMRASELDEYHPSYGPLMGFTDIWIEGPMDGNYALAYAAGPFIIMITPVTLAINAIDVVVLPFKGISRLLKNAAHKKDFRVLSQAISSSDITIKVSNKRFERIAKIIKD